eukprot:CAMPEP_0206439352 /NCGR_PEP_ID=MMETSP0324_2-20121206/12158_1 /ASSEMBLY_ACC=CAM_ASM_000836 /TAXON_ID=2866 /ORGANISM="Crypthecodinium cohnii, Strain Seligo" /LENGTH=488 /DNA_ID=CAMNT_0053906953 /DNA_START=57 /DNA_END=1523 /DNA_ORIENTATION=-
MEPDAKMALTDPRTLSMVSVEMGDQGSRDDVQQHSEERPSSTLDIAPNTDLEDTNNASSSSHYGEGQHLTRVPSSVNGVSVGGKVTLSGLTMNLIAGGLGTGMFSLPSSMSGSSVFLGVGMTFMVVSLNAVTIMILVRAAEEHQVFDLGALMGLAGNALGRKLNFARMGTYTQGFINFMVWFVLVGSLVSYLIAMHDSAAFFLQDTWFTSSKLPLVTAAAGIVLGLCFLEQKHLSWTSTIALVVNVYLIIVLVGYFFDKLAHNSLPEDVCLFGVAKGAVSMLAILAQCVIIQMCVLPMYEELEDRSPKKFSKGLWTAFLALSVIFSVFAGTGYASFGPGVKGNVLDSFPPGAISAVAQVGVILVVAAIYPLMVIPMVAPIKNMELSESMSHRRGMLVTGAILIIVFISWVGALVIPNLFLVNLIDGAICVGTFTALAPGLVGLYLSNRDSLLWRLGMAALLLFGFTNMILGLVFSDAYVVELKERCAF